VISPDGEVARCTLGGPGEPDTVAVDVVARLAQVARAVGGRLVVTPISTTMGELLALAALPVEVAALPVEVEGEAEEGEEPLGIEEGEEEAHLGDPPL
jgi:hypothetical protein